MILYTHILTIHLFCYSLTWYTPLLYGERFSISEMGDKQDTFMMRAN